MPGAKAGSGGKAPAAGEVRDMQPMAKFTWKIGRADPLRRACRGMEHGVDTKYSAQNRANTYM